MQGTLIDLRNVDYLKSQDIFRNMKMNDVLVVFWYKMHHNVLGCNYTLSIWYHSSLQCPLDNYRLESMAHLLNSCSEFKDVYSERHDKIVDKLGQELKSVSVNLFVNKCVSTSLEELNLPRNLLCLKPDIVIKHEKQIKILEVSCPYDLYLQNTFETKKSKYAPLKDAIKSKGYQCDIMPFIVGSVSLVHSFCYVHLVQPGIPKRQAKGFCKWCSDSNIFFARNIWNTRCPLVYD